ncbi:MAG: hypothetical protein AAF741_15645 [Bacteroidota bacterium]
MAKGDLRLPTSAISALTQVVTQLHRLVGGRLQVRKMQKKENDYQLSLRRSVYVRFMNRGQNPVLIDNQIILLSGEAYNEGDTAGPGIDHLYKIEFLEENPDGLPKSTADLPHVFPGNLLDIRYMERVY